MGLKLYVALGFIVFSSTYFKNYVKHIVEYCFFGLEKDIIEFVKSSAFLIIIISLFIYTLIRLMFGSNYKSKLVDSIYSISCLLELSFNLSNYLNSNYQLVTKNKELKYNFALEEIFDGELSINFPGKRAKLNEVLTLEPRISDIKYDCNNKYIKYFQNLTANEDINIFNIPASYIKLNFKLKKVSYYKNFTFEIF
jgi:hypothetical protein